MGTIATQASDGFLTSPRCVQNDDLYTLKGA
jgi:hypothetical protein